MRFKLLQKSALCVGQPNFFHRSIFGPIRQIALIDWLEFNRRVSCLNLCRGLPTKHGSSKNISWIFSLFISPRRGWRLRRSLAAMPKSRSLGALVLFALSSAARRILFSSAV